MTKNELIEKLKKKIARCDKEFHKCWENNDKNGMLVMTTKEFVYQDFVDFLEDITITE